MARRKKNVVPDIIETLSKQMILTTAKYNSKGVAVGITSIMGVKYDSIEEATKVASSIAGIPLTPHKRKPSSVMKDVNRYKHPLFPPIKQTIKVVSKTGKTYYRTILTQDVGLEKAYRSMVWQWNDAKRKGDNPDVRGKISSAGIQQYYVKHGRWNTINYIRQLAFRAKKKVASIGSLDIIFQLLDPIIEKGQMTGATPTQIENGQRAESLKQRLLNCFSSSHGVDIYDMKETRQKIYDELVNWDSRTLSVIEDFVERQERTKKQIKDTANSGRIYF